MKIVGNIVNVLTFLERLGTFGMAWFKECMKKQCASQYHLHFSILELSVNTVKTVISGTL